jgi:hypothetical protein
VLRGLGGFSAFCFLLAVFAEPIGGWAFAVAVIGTAVWQFADARSVVQPPREDRG